MTTALRKEIQYRDHQGNPAPGGFDGWHSAEFRLEVEIGEVRVASTHTIDRFCPLPYDVVWQKLAQEIGASIAESIKEQL